MKKAAFCLILTLLFAIVAAAQRKTKPHTVPPSAIIKVAKCTGNSLSDGEVTQLLAAHNLARSAVRLPPLSWDCTLAATAQAWARKGIPGHNDATSYGENVFVSSDPVEDVTAAINGWMSEKANWKNLSGTCAPGKTCTHYTQIVWRSTRKIGCGINRNVSGKWKTLLVCNYDPQALSGQAYPQ